MTRRDTSAVADDVPTRGRARPTSTHVFYVGMAMTLAALVFVGFAPTFYLRGYLRLPPNIAPLSPLIVIHGITATAWMALFVAQTCLVATRRAPRHRQLGIAGAYLAAAVVVTGTLATVDALRRGVSLQGFDPRAWWFGTTFPPVAIFAILAGVGLAWRRRIDAHKRLMLLATISVVSPAQARIALFNFGPEWLPVFGVGGPALLIATAIAYDLWTRKRVHAVLIWGGAATLGVPFLMRALAATPPALRLADLFR